MSLVFTSESQVELYDKENNQTFNIGRTTPYCLLGKWNAIMHSNHTSPCDVIVNRDNCRLGTAITWQFPKMINYLELMAAIIQLIYPIVLPFLLCIAIFLIREERTRQHAERQVSNPTSYLPFTHCHLSSVTPTKSSVRWERHGRI